MDFAGARSENVVGENIPRAIAGVGNRSKARIAFEQDFRQRAVKHSFLGESPTPAEQPVNEVNLAPSAWGGVGRAIYDRGFLRTVTVRGASADFSERTLAFECPAAPPYSWRQRS